MEHYRAEGEVFLQKLEGCWPSAPICWPTTLAWRTWRLRRLYGSLPTWTANGLPVRRQALQRWLEDFCNRHCLSA